MSKDNFRIEKDSMGEMRVPADALYGAQTQRAVENFPISNLRFPREFVRAMGLIKLAAAKANMDLGQLDKKVGEAIANAAQAATARLSARLSCRKEPVPFDCLIVFSLRSLMMQDSRVVTRGSTPCPSKLQ